MRAVMGELASSLPTGMWVLRLKTSFEPKRFASPASDALREAARDELCGLLRRAALTAAPTPALAPAPGAVFAATAAPVATTVAKTVATSSRPGR